MVLKHKKKRIYRYDYKHLVILIHSHPSFVKRYHQDLLK